MTGQLMVSDQCDDSDDGIAARVHDPLWLLARQWQTGELKGEDAGSPIGARVSVEVAPLTVWQSRSQAGAGEPLPYRATQQPLEACVEAEQWDTGAFPHYRLAAETGLRLQRLLAVAGVGGAVDTLRSRYALALPSIVVDHDPATQRYIQVMAGRVLDGVALYRTLAPLLQGAVLPALPNAPPFTAIPPSDRQALQVQLGRWLTECKELTGNNVSTAAPIGNAPAWQRERMEYAYTVGAQLGADAIRLAAPEHFEGESDWYTFVGDPAGSLAPGVVPIQTSSGAIVKIRHSATGNRLHSHSLNYGHPGTSGQQQVTAYQFADDNDLWRIKGPHGQAENSLAGQPVEDGSIIRLEHVLTRRNLHSHSGVPSPVTGQQEVSCFGNNGLGDSNDNWRIEIEGGGIWDSTKRIRLIHVNTNVALHSHVGFSHPEWTAGQQEVTGFEGRDDNDWWWLLSSARTLTFLPTPVHFRGMPNERFWELEDSRLNLPKVDAARTDVASRLFLDFALRYSNDWFVLPLQLPTGSVSRLSALVITNNFGDQSLVRHVNAREPNSPWKMYSLWVEPSPSTPGSGGSTVAAYSDIFVLPATLGQVLESAPVEKVRLLRDEMANVGWAVEVMAESAIGQSFDRLEQYQRKRSTQEAELGASTGAVPRYQLGSTLPDYWIPLLPAPSGQGNTRRLQRAAAPRIENDQIVGILLPQSRLLEPGTELYIFDEEVPREGAEVSRRYRYARAADGSLHLWIGRSKRPGQGEGSSGLRFDSIEPYSRR